MDLKALESYMRILVDEEQPCAILITMNEGTYHLTAQVIEEPKPDPNVFPGLLDSNGETYMIAEGGNIEEALIQLDHVEVLARFQRSDRAPADEVGGG